MNKKILIAGIVIIAVFASYSAFWFYQSEKIKFSIEQAAGKISKEIGRKNTELFYTSSNISGYPFNFTVSVNQPKFISAGGGEKIEITSGDEPVVIISNILGNGYKVKFPTNIDIKQTVDEKETSYRLEFIKESPYIEAKFSSDFLFGMANIQELIPYISDNLKNLRYFNYGYKLTSVEGGRKLASADSQMVQISKTTSKTNSISTSYNIKIENADAAAFFSQENKPAQPAVESAVSFWPVTTSADFSTIDSKDGNGKSNSVEFVVRDIDIKAASFGMAMKGEIKASGNDIFPFGDLSIKINNYSNMVDYFGGVVSNAFAQTNLPLFHIKSEKSIDFKKVLYDVSSEKSNQEQDILLTLSRQQGQSLFIGQKGLMEVIDLLKASTSNADESLKDGAFVQPRVAPQVPAAGLDLGINPSAP